MKHRYSVLPKHVQKYYKQQRPKKIVSDFLRERFYLPMTFIKQLSHTDQPFYFEYSVKTWNDIHYHVRARKGLNNRTSLLLEARWKHYTFSEERKNDPEFFFLLFFIMIRIPKSGLVETMRIGKDTTLSMSKFNLEFLSAVKKRTMIPSTKSLPFDIEKGLNPNRILELLNAKSKTGYLTSM